MNHFKIARERGWPKILCARYAGLTQMPGKFRQPYSVRGCYIDDIHPADYLPMVRNLRVKKKKQ